MMTEAVPNGSNGVIKGHFQESYQNQQLDVVSLVSERRTSTGRTC